MARYVFFRTPEGRRDRSPEMRSAPVELLSHMGKSAQLAAGGAVSWPFAAYHEYEVPIRCRMGIADPDGGELNDTDTSRIVLGAIRTLVSKTPGKPVLPSALLREAEKEALGFFRRPFTQYAMVTTLSMKSLPCQRISDRGVIISSLKTRARYPLPEYAKTAFPNTKSLGRPHSEYLIIRASTRGRSIYEAATIALDSLNLLRAIWSLFLTYRSWTVLLGGSTYRPLGIIHTGHIQTLHYPDGRCITEDVIWFDPHSAEAWPIFDAGAKWASVEKGRRWAMRCLSRLLYAADLRDLLVRYVLALDEPDPQVAFLKMWGILEKITDSVGAGYDQTIDRTLWVYPKDRRGVAKDNLDSLRVVRNRYVHSGTGHEQPDQIAYLIKSFVDPHLMRLLNNPFGSNSLAEYASCLSLPTEIDALKRKRIALTKAIALASKAQQASVGKKNAVIESGT
jgi:hypothetical protein